MVDTMQTKAFPRIEDIAWFEVDKENKRQIVITKDMMVEQLSREGPKIAASFDEIAKETVTLCSGVIARSYGAIIRDLPNVENFGFEATASRLIASSINSFTASVEVARHGYPLQYGTISRGVHETLAVVLVLATDENALEAFHRGSLKSTKCITKAKQILPHLGRMWSWFSDTFVHIGAQHASLDLPKLWKPDDDALDFVLRSMRHDAWLIYVVVELVFAQRFSTRLYWQNEGMGFVFSPSDQGNAQMDTFLYYLAN